MITNIIKFNDYLSEGLLKGKSKEDVDKYKNSITIDKYLREIVGRELSLEYVLPEIKEFDDKLKTNKYEDLNTSEPLSTLFYGLYFSYNQLMYDDGDYSYHMFLLNTNMFNEMPINSKAYILDCGFNVVNTVRDDSEFEKLLINKTKEIINNITEIYLKTSLSIYISDNDLFNQLLKTNDKKLKSKNDYDYTLLDVAYLSGNDNAFVDLLTSPIGFKITDITSSTTSNLFKDKKLLQLIVNNFDKLLMVDVKTYRELIVALKPYININ